MKSEITVEISSIKMSISFDAAMKKLNLMVRDIREEIENKIVNMPYINHCYVHIWNSILF